VDINTSKASTIQLRRRMTRELRAGRLIGVEKFAIALAEKSPFPAAQSPSSAAQIQSSAAQHPFGRFFTQLVALLFLSSRLILDGYFILFYFLSQSNCFVSRGVSVCSFASIGGRSSQASSVPGDRVRVCASGGSRGS